MEKKSFSDLSPSQQLLAILSMVVAGILVVTAERDLHRRPAEEVRGDKRVWRLVCLNALGAVAYLRWGRQASGAI